MLIVKTYTILIIVKKPLTIAFDATQLTTKNISGVGYFSVNLLKSLSAQYPQNKFVGFYGSRLFDREATLEHLPLADNITYVKVFPPVQVLYLLRRMGLTLPIEAVIRRFADIVIYPNFLGFGSLRKDTKLVNVIHDLTYVHYPDSMSGKFLSDLNKHLPSQVKKANLIITPSKQVAKEISKFFDIDSEMIIDCPIPASPEENYPRNENNKPRTKPYCIFIGTVEPRKNIKNLLLAFEGLPELRDHYDLHIVGKMGWDKELNDYFKQFVQNNHFVKYHSYVDKEKKDILFYRKQVHAIF